VATAVKDAPDLHGGLDHLLEVVEQQQHPLPLEICGKRLAKLFTRRFAHRQRLRDPRNDELWIPDRCKRDKEHAALESIQQLACDLEREPRLAGPSWAG